MKNNRDTVYECTSSSFDGFVFFGYYFMVLTFGDVFAVIHCNQRKLTIQRAFKLTNVSNLAHSENYRVVP